MIQQNEKTNGMDMDSLMQHMLIPNSRNSKTEFISSRVTYMPTQCMVEEIISAGENCYAYDDPSTATHSVEIVTRLREILGVDLAGHFSAEVSLRDRDAIVRLFFKNNALGIGIAQDVSKAFGDALHVGMIPALKSLRTDLNTIIEKLFAIGG